MPGRVLDAKDRMNHAKEEEPADPIPRTVTDDMASKMFPSRLGYGLESRSQDSIGKEGGRGLVEGERRKEDGID